jgi:hypothetical protein
MASMCALYAYSQRTSALHATPVAIAISGDAPPERSSCAEQQRCVAERGRTLERFVLRRVLKARRPFHSPPDCYNPRPADGLVRRFFMR